MWSASMSSRVKAILCASTPTDSAYTVGARRDYTPRSLGCLKGRFFAGTDILLRNADTSSTTAPDLTRSRLSWDPPIATGFAAGRDALSLFKGLWRHDSESNRNGLNRQLRIIGRFKVLDSLCRRREAPTRGRQRHTVFNQDRP
jgi:hypothetical protein